MRLIVSIMCLCLALAGTTAYAASKTIATVNGKKISQKDYDQFVKVIRSKNPQFNDQANRDALIGELVKREVLFQEAKKKKVHKDPQVAYVLKQQKMELMIKALMSNTVGKQKVKEKHLKKLYNDKVLGASRKEFNARHILLKSEDDAKAVIAELDSGKDFKKLAEKKSTGPSASSGGDLGWFPANRMVPPFARAVSEMKKGTYSKSPVQTKFGWHVIKLEDTRNSEPPKFEDVKQQLENSIKQQKAQEYVDKLVKKAKVDIKK